MSDAHTDHPVHELIRKRWSPYGFADEPVSGEDLRSLFEAARWAASSYNEQPWSYVLGNRADDPEQHGRVLSCLVEANQAWAKHAPVLALGIASRFFKKNGKPNGVALHDLGLAAGNLSLEATARGLVVHQMAGILPDRAREVFSIPEGHDAITAIAIGHLKPAGELPDELRQRDEAPRQRRPLRDFVFGARWGESSAL
jgi:nitroreductase